MKKIIIAVLCVVIILLGFLHDVKHKSRQEVIFWTLQMSDFSVYINGVISDFETQYPDIKIKWVDVPFSEGEKRTLAAVLSLTPPDLVNLNPDFSALLAQRGALWEIDDKYTYSFNQKIIDSLRYDDKLYSIPWYATSAITIYNKDLLDKAGVRVPKTYEDLEKIAPIIKEKTDAYAFLPNITENDVMLRILNKYGINSPETINSEKSVEVFNNFKKMYEDDLIPKESLTQTHREALEKYMAEKTVFFQAGANFLNMIKENAPEVYKKTDVAPQIKGDLGQNDFSLMNFVIPARAQHKEQALKFALFLTNDKNQVELGKLANVLPTNKGVLRTNYYTVYDESKHDLAVKVRVISAEQLNKIQPAFKSGRNQKEVNTLINTAVQEIMLNKDTTENILNDIAKKWKSVN